MGTATATAGTATGVRRRSGGRRVNLVAILGLALTAFFTLIAGVYLVANTLAAFGTSVFLLPWEPLMTADFRALTALGLLLVVAGLIAGRFRSATPDGAV